MKLRLLVMLEMQQERIELRQLGLSEDEIDGYFDYYIDSYLPDLGGDNALARKT